MLDNLRSWTRGAGGGDPGKDFARYEYDVNNRLTAIRNSANNLLHAFGYDVQGNLYSKDARTFHFDFGNRQRSNSYVEGFRYDAHGRRVLRWTPALGTDLFVYGNDGRLLFEHADSRQARIEHIFLGDERVATREMPYAGGVVLRYQHNDALGSPVAVTDEYGAVVDRTDYEPFGKPIGESVNGVGYTGHVMDPANGMVYMQQRYYDPEVGRFLSVDPVAADTIGGLNFNRYNYGNNNPFRFTDPDGRLANETQGKQRKLDRRSICDRQPTRCSRGGAAGSNPGITSRSNSASPTSQNGFTAENAGARKSEADARLAERLEGWRPSVMLTELAAAAEFARLTQDITTKFGVEFGAVLVDHGTHWTIENLSSGTFMGGALHGNVWISPVSAPPGGKLTYSDIHTHPLEGATHSDWYSPFSSSDMAYLGKLRGLLSLPDGSIWSINPPNQRPERLR